MNVRYAVCREVHVTGFRRVRVWTFDVTTQERLLDGVPRFLSAMQRLGVPVSATITISTVRQLGPGR